MQPAKPARLGPALYRYRSFTPLPFVAVLWWFARPCPLAFVAGVGIATLGEGLRLWAIRHVGPKTRSSRKLRADGLVTTGPFAYVRNPLYLGNALLCLGIAVASGTPWLPLGLPLLFLFWWRSIIPAEERFLAGAFGDEFARYRAQVRRFLPRLTPYRRAPGAFPPREVLRAELSTIVSAEIVLVVIGRAWLPV